MIVNFIKETINLIRQTDDSWIFYTTSNEDSQSELNALDIKEDDEVLSITGSACRSLALLTKGPKRLYSVDADVKQNYLLELKLSAFKHLTYGELLAFLGIYHTNDRLKFYQRFKGSLTPKASEFWDKHLKEIEKGVLFTGRQELFYRHIMGPGIRLLHRKGIQRLINCNTLEEQRLAYERLNNQRWEKSLNFFCKKIVYKSILKDPSYFAYSEVDSLGRFLHSRIEHTLTNHPLTENHLLSFLFTGNYMSERALPVYLLKENYEKIRKYADRVEIVTSPIDCYLEGMPDNSFDKYSLSDISGWVSNDDFNKILKEIIRTGRNESIFCYRNFLAKRIIPREFYQSIEIQESIIEKLNRDDRSFAFTFGVGKILKGDLG